jgi:hypothetical protein
MANKIQLRRDIAANWNNVNPVLAQGEPGIETDTDRMKIGDGVTAWTALAYFVSGSGGGYTGSRGYTGSGSGGSGTPGGSNTQVQFNDSGVFAGDSTFNFNKTTKVLSVNTLTVSGNVFATSISGTTSTANSSVILSTGYSLTGSDTTPMVDLQGSWNTTGVATGFRLAITNVASDPNSILFTVGTGTDPSASKFRVGVNGNITVSDGGNLVVGSTTGTKVATSSTQKLGFFGVNPVVQPAAIADATDGTDVITQLNDLLAKLRLLGLISN